MEFKKWKKRGQEKLESFKLKRFWNFRGQLVWQEMIPWIIGLGVLLLVVLLYVMLSGKGEGAIIAYLKDAWRYGVG